MNKVYEETDKYGKHKVIEQPNGVKIRILKEPSAWYQSKLEERSAAAEQHEIESRARAEQEQLIKDKMRELAIKELQSEGKLP